ncbi:transcription antitermination factor NusB [Salipaludibacillus agaradhaerens]|uniref:Transcription antitermination protein NusB n=1 Tax=Salipaludibacillus agaradhaerens TaxID=76935 RepID=A0A9Q4B1L8_SALAG|nr:transcription antitermination factor NusB [Salipaludibacillus agaradhaerens]MCR6096667.1 transcription antitermination factor NusB [Salipaludibacillus agaradhaerens]MCR6113774.1 transcription antitermination factor NusB [Salipaludibacillus agaradhaerens]
MNRRLARIRTVQALYQIEMTETAPSEAMASVLQDNEVPDDFFHGLVNGTFSHLQEIDRLLTDALEHWSINRISRVDRAILRLAVYEMKYETDIPVNVSINEAIDLAKGFAGEEESGKFANGVLSKIAETLEK